VDTDTGTAATTVNSVWVNWNNQWTQLGTLQNVQVVNVQVVNVPTVVPQHSAEQLEKMRKQAEEVEKKRLEAKERARKLLLATLTEKQREQFEKEHAFELMVNDRLYRVSPGKRVERLDPKTKKVQSMFCIHPEMNYTLPAEDTALSQKLLLEADEVAFLRLANETRVAA
jgi:hypothetical protein